MRTGTFVFAVAALALAAPAGAQQGLNEPRPMNVRLTFQIIGANGQARDEPEIRAVVTELRKLFRFEGYHLLASSILNATAWPRSSVEQFVADDQGRRFHIEAHVESNGPGIRLAVQLADERGLLINAAVNLEDGKTVVLGTAAVRSPVKTGDVEALDAGSGADPMRWSRWPGGVRWLGGTVRSGLDRRVVPGKYALLPATGGGPVGLVATSDHASAEQAGNAAIILVVTPTINP